MKLVACHYAGSLNVGDAVCSPASYFDFDIPTEIVRFGEPIPPCDAVIFGGGAIGNRVGKIVTPARYKIAWGVGETRHGRTECNRAPEGFDLYGSRDWEQEGAEWIPCASCMSPLFDKTYEVQLEAALYYNFRRLKPAVAGLPELHNEVSFEEAVAFLGSAETVVTNSYHGAFWATLLGRKVRIIEAYSSKLYQFRHKPGPRYPEALEECRAANRGFYAKVMDLLA